MTFVVVIKDSENNKSTQFMLNKSALIQRNTDKINTIALAV